MKVPSRSRFQVARTLFSGNRYDNFEERTVVETLRSCGLAIDFFYRFIFRSYRSNDCTRFGHLVIIVE